MPSSARDSAFSTYGIQLMCKGTTAYEKLVDIKDFPNMGGQPEQIETTTLSNPVQTFCEGVQSLEALVFTANYIKSDYDKIKALEGTQKFALFIGKMSQGVSDGSDGKFYFNGTVNCYLKGAGVNDVAEMEITITPSTSIDTTEPA